MGSLELLTPLFFFFSYFVVFQVARKFLFFPSSLCLQKVQSAHFSFFPFFEMFLFARDKEIRIHCSFLFPFLECCCYLQRSEDLEAPYSLLFFLLLLLLPKRGGGGPGVGTPQIYDYYYFLKGIEKWGAPISPFLFFSFSFFLTYKKLGVSNYPLHCFLIFVFWCKVLTCLFKDFFFIFWTYFWQVIHIKIMKNPFFTHYHAKKMDFFGGFLFSYIYFVTRCFFIHFV